MENLRYALMPVIKVVLFCVFLWLCAIPFSLISQFQFLKFDAGHPLMLDIIGQLTGVLTVLGALLMIFRVFPLYNFDRVFITQQMMFKSFGKGTLIGCLMLSCCVSLAYFTGNVSFSTSRIDLLLVLGYLVLFVLVGIVEEFIFRSFPLLAFAEQYPPALAIAIPSILFGLAHYFNPGFSWLAMLNISLIGAILAFFVLLKRDIYWAVGLHFGWNFSQGCIFGYKVSGTDTKGLLVAHPIGSTYLSGGVFGIEASIICTVVIVFFLIYLAVKHKLEFVEELASIEE